MEYRTVVVRSILFAWLWICCLNLSYYYFYGAGRITDFVLWTYIFWGVLTVVLAMLYFLPTQKLLSAAQRVKLNYSHSLGRANRSIHGSVEKKIPAVETHMSVDSGEDVPLTASGRPWHPEGVHCASCGKLMMHEDDGWYCDCQEADELWLVVRSGF